MCPPLSHANGLRQIVDERSEEEIAAEAAVQQELMALVHKKEAEYALRKKAEVEGTASNAGPGAAPLSTPKAQAEQQRTTKVWPICPTALVACAGH